MKTTIVHIYAVIFFSALLISCENTSHNQHQTLAGGQSGYDKNISALEPNNDVDSVSLAGEIPIDISRYFMAANQAPWNVSLSPDGKSIAFIWSITGKQQLWLMPNSGGQPKQLTFGNGIRFYSWAKTENKIIYSADNNGDEQEAYYLINETGTQESLVVPPVSGGFRAFGDFITNDTIVYASTERNKLDFDIYVANLATGKSKMLIEGRMGLYARSVSPDGKHIIVSERVGEDSENLYLVTIGTNKLVPLSVPKRRAAHVRGGINWSSDSKGFFLSSNLDSNFSSLRYYDLQSGFKTLITADGDIENVKLCGENDKYLLWSVNQGGYSKLFIKNMKSKRTNPLAENISGVINASCNTNSSKVLLNINSWNTPGDILAIDLDTQRQSFVFKTNMAGIALDSLIQPESIVIRARDGVQLQGLLYLPKESNIKGEGKPPIVFSVHGGPTAQSRPRFSPTTQYLLGQGIAVFYPNVRGSTGFGHHYVTLDDQKNRLNSIRDLVDMLEYLKQDGRVDASRAVVKGGSYGGYAVNAALANFPGNFIAGVALFGVSDWVNALQIASPSLKAADRVEYGDINDDKWLKYYSVNSPIAQAQKINVPVLYSHGAKDPRVDISETETMVKILRKNGINVQYIRFLDEGHGWRKFNNQLFYARAEVDFLNSIFYEK